MEREREERESERDFVVDWREVMQFSNLEIVVEGFRVTFLGQCVIECNNHYFGTQFAFGDNFPLSVNNFWLPVCLAYAAVNAINFL